MTTASEVMRTDVVLSRREYLTENDVKRIFEARDLTQEVIESTAQYSRTKNCAMCINFFLLAQLI